MHSKGIASGSGPRDYLNYTSDDELARVYGEYQKKYAENPRESDKKTAQLVIRCLKDMSIGDRAPRILDIGCSTGNFMRHLRAVLPDAAIIGGDLMVPVIEQCRKDPTLKGMPFEVMDVFDIPSAQPFDVITANAVNVYFEADEYRRAAASIAKALRPGGALIAYEWVCPGNEQRKITETSAWHPNGLTFWFRAEAIVDSAFRGAGFAEVSVEHFELPIDLPPPAPGSVAEASLETYTLKELETGRRMMFRGTLYQPWAHILAVKGK